MIKFKYFVQYLFDYLTHLIFINKNKNYYDVIFSVNNPTFAQARIAKYLKYHKKKVLLLHKNKANYNLSNFFIKHLMYRNKFHLLKILKSLNFTALHLFSENIDSETILLLKKYRQSIYHPTDILIDTKFFQIKKKKLQEHAFEVANRFIFRDLTINNFADIKNKIKNKVYIFYPEYLFPKIKVKKENSIHIVNTGNLLTRNVDNGKLLFEFVEKVTNDGCYFHIYPHWQFHNQSLDNFKKLIPEYINIKKRNNRVIIHNCLNPQLIQKEISKYHFGIMIRAEFEDNYYGVKGNYNYEYLRGSGSSRISDYLESDLKIITNWRSKRDLCYFIPNRYTTIINFKDVLRSSNAYIYLDKILKIKDNKKITFYSAKHNIKRLINFYEKKEY